MTDAGTEAEVVATIAELRAAGFASDFAIEVATIPPSVLCLGCHRYVLARTATIDAVRSFPGSAGDPRGTLVFALRCPRCAVAGVLLVRPGWVIAPEEAQVVTELDRLAGHPDAREGPPDPEVAASAAD